MKASKKVIGSVTASGLAVALIVTAVTSNHALSADRKEVTAETQLVKNGMAGFSVVMNEYEFEAADYLDSYVSVEPAETNLVAASVEKTEESTPTEEQKEEAPISEEEKEWQNKLMAKVDDFLYVREKADADSEIVGKMYKGDRAVVKKAGDTWTKIESGSVKGYVKNEYCVTGQDAFQYAKKHCKTVATVSIDGLRIRKSPSTDAEVVKTVASGERFDVNKKADTKDGWVAIKTESGTCYVSEEFVTTSLSTGKAVTLEEEEAARKAEEERKAQEAKEAEAKKNSTNAAAGTDGQTSSDGTASQGSAVAASADDETLLAALVQCEAGGTSVECMTAVGAVVINRLHSGFAGSIHGVIYQRGQFGPASSGRLASRLASGVSSSARQAARAALGGYDPTGGAKYFKLASSGHDGVVIGPIVFY